MSYVTHIYMNHVTHIWMSNVTHNIQSQLWNKRYVDLKRMSHATLMGWVMSHTHTWVMSRTYVMGCVISHTHTWVMSRTYGWDKSSHTCRWVVPHTYWWVMSHTYGWVISHTHAWVMSHTHTSSSISTCRGQTSSYLLTKKSCISRISTLRNDIVLGIHTYMLNKI